MRRLRLSQRAAGTILGVVFLAALPTSAGAEPAEPSVDGRLSDEAASSRWATPVTTAAIRARPSESSRRVTRLRMLTEDRFPEVYLLLDRKTDEDGTVWVQLRVPARPNGRTGWVQRDALGPFHRVRTALVIDRRALRASFYRAGRRVWSARVGIGKRGTVTPAGRFWVRERFRVRGGTIYGPYAFGTSAYSTLSDWPGGGVVGIHGTNEPALIPGRPSHGCVRMRNRDILWLSRNLAVGSPLLIR